MPVVKPTKSWTDISTEFQSLPAGEYHFKIVEIEEGETKKNSLPQVQIKSEILSGELAGRSIVDFIVLATNKGGDNDVGFGKLKQYAIAVHGEDVVEDPDFELNTDDLINGEFLGQVKARRFKKEGEDEFTESSELKRVLPLG